MTPEMWHVPKQTYPRSNIQYSHRPKFSSVSLYDDPFLSYGLIPRKAHRMTPKWPWPVVVSIYVSHTFNIHPRDSNISPFGSTMSRFQATAQFEKSAPYDPRMALTCSRSKYLIFLPKKHPRDPSCRHFRSTRRHFRVMTLTYSRSKVPKCLPHTPPRPNFSSVWLYGEPFLKKSRFLNFTFSTIQ